MFEAAVDEFPFVESLPHREKSKLVRVWELVGQLREASAKEGALVPVMLAARCLGISRSRVDQVVEDGRLRRVSVDGHVFITENSMVEFAKSERVNGRPCKVPQTAREMWQIAREVASKKK